MKLAKHLIHKREEAAADRLAQKIQRIPKSQERENTKSPRARIGQEEKEQAAIMPKPTRTS